MAAPKAKAGAVRKPRKKEKKNITVGQAHNGCRPPKRRRI